MKTIRIYDPAMCCPTGICGTDIDPDLVNFSALLSQLAQHGIQIERYNLSKRPMEFAKNPEVKEALEADGDKALPLIFIDGEVCLKGRYPTREERAAWTLRAKAATDKDSMEKDATKKAASEKEETVS